MCRLSGPWGLLVFFFFFFLFVLILGLCVINGWRMKTYVEQPDDIALLVEEEDATHVS